MKLRFAIILLAGVSLAACSGENNDELVDDLATPHEKVAEEVPAMDGEANSEGQASSDASDIPDQVNPQAEIRPVRYGLDGDSLDACGGYGEIADLKSDGDNFLSVRGAPRTTAYELDRLDPGQGVYMCEAEDGWVGIVYDKTGEMDCGTGSPIDAPTDYEGPCESGWVSERFVTLMAG